MEAVNNLIADPANVQKMYVIAAVIVLIFVIYYIATWNTNANENYIYGYWSADDDEFCDESDMSSMMLFIGEAESSFGRVTRQCHIIITDDIYNGGFTMNYKRGWAGPTIGKYNINVGLEFEDAVTDVDNGGSGSDSTSTESLWPDNVMFSFNMTNGTLLVHSGEMVYARLHKNHEISNGVLSG